MLTQIRALTIEIEVVMTYPVLRKFIFNICKWEMFLPLPRKKTIVKIIFIEKTRRRPEQMSHSQ